MLHAAANDLGNELATQAGSTRTLEQSSQAINYAMQISTQCSIALAPFTALPSPSPPAPVCVCACNACSSAANEWGFSVVICRRFVVAAEAAAAGAIRTSMRVGSSETDPNLPERSLAHQLAPPRKPTPTATATATKR